MSLVQGQNGHFFGESSHAIQGVRGKAWVTAEEQGNKGESGFSCVHFNIKTPDHTSVIKGNRVELSNKASIPRTSGHVFLKC